MKCRRRLARALAFAFLVSLAAIAQPSAQKTSPNGQLDSAVAELRYEDLADAVKSLPADPEQDYFAGVLANREGRVQESIRRLEAALPSIRKANPARAAVALHTLADDYVKSYRYRDANSAYQDLLTHFRHEVDTAELQGLEDDASVAKLLVDAPAQSISFDGPVQIKTYHSPLGTIDTDLAVNGVTGPWILDTGANFSVVSASYARRLGLNPSRGEGQTQGISGAENRLHVAILPELRIGGATVRNVVLLVLEDGSLNVQSGKDTHYQINAIVGYPLFQALQRVTFAAGEMSAAGSADDASRGAKLFMEDLSPLIECQFRGRNLLFDLDTGASASVLSVRFYRDFPEAFRSLSPKPDGLAGAGGVKIVEAYHLPEMMLEVGDQAVVLHNATALPVAQNTWLDKTYGNLGRDLMEGFRSFTLDFANMRFAMAPAAGANGK